MSDFRAVVVQNSLFFFNDTATTEIYTLSLHDALPISTVCTATPLPVNAWTHLAVTYDGTTLSLFRNGVLVASRPGSGPVAAAPGAVASSTSTLQIGASQFGEYFNGLIDEVRVYDRALSPSDVQALSGPVASVHITSVTVRDRKSVV